MGQEFDFSTVRKQIKDFSQIEKIIAKAEQSLNSARNLFKSDKEASFTLAYESMLKTSLGLMLSYGYRPRISLGHHKTLVEFARYVLDKKFAPLISTYNRMRSKRNKLIYEISFISETETLEALKIADDYIKIVKQKISRENPQAKLF